jgi:chorismate mutase
LYNAGIKKLGKFTEVFYLRKKQSTIFHGNCIELQNRFPDLPLLIDPSHITGDRDILEVTQRP